MLEFFSKHSVNFHEFWEKSVTPLPPAQDYKLRESQVKKVLIKKRSGPVLYGPISVRPGPKKKWTGPFANTTLRMLHIVAGSALEHSSHPSVLRSLRIITILTLTIFFILVSVSSSSFHPCVSIT
jgi:hypothetical protein